MAVITVQDLNVVLSGHHVLDHISFTVQPGEIVAVVGPNGSGKTTLLKALLGLISFKGTVELFDLPFSPQVLRRIGYVPQRLEFDRTMPVTVKELMAVHLAHGGRQRIRAALRAVDAAHLLERTLGVLSGGEFQRVLLALAVLNDPEMLFLDEPAASIDIEGSGEVYTLLERLQRERSLTIVLVSHDVDVVYRYASQVLCVNHRLVCQGVPHAVLTPQTIEELYGAKHGLYRHKEKLP